MKLWVFGDSFSHNFKDFDFVNERRKEDHKFQKIERNWVDIVAEKLTGSVAQENFSQYGCANEYIYLNLRNNMERFREGDCVIVTLTSSERRWFVETLPHLANFENCKYSPDTPNSYTKDQAKAVESYTRHLVNEEAQYAIYDAIFWATMNINDYVADRGVNFLILPSWNTIPGINGLLTTVCNNEFDSTETLNKFYKKTTDNRWNHLTEVNHHILANKVYDYFTKGITVDLTTGFETAIYNKDNI